MTFYKEPYNCYARLSTYLIESECIWTINAELTFINEYVTVLKSSMHFTDVDTILKIETKPFESWIYRKFIAFNPYGSKCAHLMSPMLNQTYQDYITSEIKTILNYFNIITTLLQICKSKHDEDKLELQSMFTLKSLSDNC